MPAPESTSLRSLAFVLWVALALVLEGCDGTYRSPVAPAPPAPAPAPDFVAFYIGDAVLREDTTSAACGSEPPVGTLSGWPWQVVITGISIQLILGEEGEEAEYRGTLMGRDFETMVVMSKSTPVRRCEWREVWVSGTFAEDYTSFEAYMTFVFGPPEAQTTQEWSWSARRRN